MTRRFKTAFQVLLLTSAVSCGSVASRPVGGTGGSTAADAGGTGGAPASDAGGLGGATGTGGGSGAGGSGAGGSGPVDAGVFVRGALGPFGPASPSTGAIRIARQRMGPTMVCGGNLCVSGGLIPQ